VGRRLGAAAARRHSAIPPGVITGLFSAAATFPRPMGADFVLRLKESFFESATGGDPDLAASCALLMLTACSHELRLSLLCPGCICTVGFLAILRDFACSGTLHFGGVVYRHLMVAGCWVAPPTLI
jgi:hypothetical protein